MQSDQNTRKDKEIDGQQWVLVRGIHDRSGTKHYGWSSEFQSHRFAEALRGRRIRTLFLGVYRTVMKGRQTSACKLWSP